MKTLIMVAISGRLKMINKIFNEDCLIGMKNIPDKSVDMILCDLPYQTTQKQGELF